MFDTAVASAMLPSWLLAVILGVAGAIAGSFLSTIVVRWPADRSVLHGRSACDGCGRTLAAWELIPIVSAIAARGRCRSCGARINPRHTAVEIGCAAIGIVSALATPGLAGIAGAVFGWLLLTLAVLDADEFWLPDPLVAALALTGLASANWCQPPLVDRLIGGAGGFALLWLVAAGYRLARGREGLGGGDPKLFGAIGLWLGWRMLPAVLLLAGLIGLGVVLLQIIRGRTVDAQDALPFGTFLGLAAYPAWLVMVILGP
ncbi:leader peptidase (prepilin peptidase) / N-methyltransferase [Sphingomonas palmae]|uniref:Prepilin leader peptidase/N-methyltransferase n=1 Tax=Sphingomonas palmae TaxID=1855283 RepID=A0A1H7TX50_9SPHN|nr:A24 family peptidase [Sphingomonas palmae]SEL89452.1 leader peptidase (prepilin peptidase) / N-methyltransferase [Sphingomonas palmae]